MQKTGLNLHVKEHTSCHLWLYLQRGFGRSCRYRHKDKAGRLTCKLFTHTAGVCDTLVASGVNPLMWLLFGEFQNVCFKAWECVNIEMRGKVVVVGVEVWGLRQTGKHSPVATLISITQCAAIEHWSSHGTLATQLPPLEVSLTASEQ